MNSSVTTSPTPALLDVNPLAVETIDTADSVGAVLSNVTLPPSAVTDCTKLSALPAASPPTLYVHAEVVSSAASISAMHAAELSSRPPVTAAQAAESSATLAWLFRTAVSSQEAPLIVNSTTPSLSPMTSSYAHDQPVPAPEDVSVTTTAAPAAATPPTVNAHVGAAASASLASINTVTVSPVFASVASAAESDAIDTVVNVGATLSNVTDVPSPTVIT